MHSKPSNDILQAKIKCIYIDPSFNTGNAFVVSGEDQTGISKQIGWKGAEGSGIVSCEKSLFEKDTDTGLVIINLK